MLKIDTSAWLHTQVPDMGQGPQSPPQAGAGPFPEFRDQSLLRNDRTLAADSCSSFLELLPCPCSGHTQGLPGG